ncbi:GAF domain-containing sensor histidine kinase [Gillisia sp. M10.2A]|uniref:histidine kinase n=1 Tax=Gillisia lutea TaxID=2909668 RepID=A0ABS9EG77_9FLAO|nr:GAF domain-containing sensor histidine kinase [Gillisia lutea]MCF4101871.1 GAF domain-containing sensor histidine kinase [Gillisia lutea]
MLREQNSTILNDVEAINKISAVPSLLNVICRTTGMRFAAIARVTDEKWVTCMAQDEIEFGLKPGDELELESTICNEIRQHHNPVIIPHVAKDVNFCGHHTPLRYGFQSYISIPIFRRDGRFFGTLCAIDPEPAKIDTVEVKEMFFLYAQLIAFHLETVEELEEVSASLKEERHVAELRETFIAILGHDLRNPVGTTRMCADILLKLPLSDIAKRQATVIKSTSYRMQELIDNLLDYAKGHLGDGINLDLSDDKSLLENALTQVVDEMSSMYNSNAIEANIQIEEKVTCDANRIAQLFSNLLGNAVKHGAEDQPIHVSATTNEGDFSLCVANSGNRISDEAMMDIFKPFFTQKSERNSSGLGLGLYISSEIAKAHHGTMSVESTDEKTCFSLKMPLRPLPVE